MERKEIEKRYHATKSIVVLLHLLYYAICLGVSFLHMCDSVNMTIL